MSGTTAIQIAQRFAKLTPEQRSSLYQEIRGKNLDIGLFPVVGRPESDAQQCPSSYAQTRQWFLWRLDRDSTAYHLSIALKLTGQLDIQAFTTSFNILIDRHEALRTVFRPDAEGMVEQHILQHLELNIPVIDVETENAVDKNQKVSDECQRINAAPFDLISGPLLRVELIRTAAQEHVLVVVIHHIISDGWSIQILINEFAALYEAQLQQTDAGLPPLPVQYADYAIWQRYWMEAGEKERQLSYWREQLGDHHPVMMLPTDYPRQHETQYTAARVVLDLPADLVGCLRDRARAEGATLFMVLLTGIQILLQRYTGQDDIRIGIPIANRHRVETEGVVGFFVNTQVMRNVIYPDSTLQQLLRQTREASLGAQAHQDLPFEQLVETLAPDRHAGVSPLFQVMFNHQAQSQPMLKQLSGLLLEECKPSEQNAQFELAVDSSEDVGTGSVRVRFTYAKALFESATIERLAGHFEKILKVLAETPERAVRTLDLLAADELQQLIRWGTGAVQNVANEPVHRLIERQVQQSPDATAVVLGGEQLAYWELNTRANRLAHYLIGLGVKPEVRVGIAVERSIDMVVGLLAILKAGGAYVPLDPTYPNARLGYMIQDSGVGVLLTQRHLVELLPVSEIVQLVVLDDIDLAGQPDINPAVMVHSENQVYVIYTSGSTGTPKGVSVAQAALSAHLQAINAHYRIQASDRLLQFASISFDAAGEQWMLPLIEGAAIVLPQERYLSFGAVAAMSQQHGISVLYMPPAYLRQLTESMSAAALPMRLCIAGGEAWLRNEFTCVQRACVPEKMFNAYGPAETVITPTVWDGAANSGHSAYMPVGRPVGQRKAVILDMELNPVPQGVVGELYLGGMILARGYLDRAGLTAGRFVADPFSATGERLYRTGDLVRWNLEGQLEYVGRIDHQIKIRGFRIEPGEIEAQLLQQPEVKEAVVVARETDGDLQLVGYVSGQSIVPEIVRERLSQSLPEYMVPTIVVLETGLPLSANGKVDRNALPDLSLDVSREYEPPQNAVEVMLATIWAEILKVERVGRADNFFGLGGHSLLALKLIERLRHSGWVLPVRTLFQHPQLKSLARVLTRQVSGLELNPGPELIVPPNRIPAGCKNITPEMVTLLELNTEEITIIEALVPGQAANIQDIYPLAPLQEGILFHHLLQHQNDTYITPFLLGFDSKERIESFVACLNIAVQRHDVLRTAVLWEGVREPVQVVYRHAQLDIDWLVASGQQDPLAQLEHYSSVMCPGINISRAPMVRAIAIHDPAHNRWLLQLLSHHLVSDHTTLELLLNEIAQIQRGRAYELSEPVPFRRFVAQARLGVSQEEHQAFFGKMLSGVSEPTAPFGLLDIHSDGKDIEETRLSLSSGLAANIRRQAQKYNVSAAALFHLAWALVLNKTTGKDDVVFGTVLLGRMQGFEGAGQALGMFINTLPIRINLGTLSVLECLTQTHYWLTELLHHEHASLTLAQGCSDLPGGTPLFSTLMNYRYSHQQEGEGISQILEGVESLGGQERTNYPINMSVDDLGDGFRLKGQVAASVGAKRFCIYMEIALSGIVAALELTPQQVLGDLELLTPVEHNQLALWNINNRSYTDVKPIHYLIEQQAQQAPYAPAVSFGDETLTFAELNTRANCLAHYLLGLGVTAECKVGIAVERSLEMIVGLLAILKAGGTYVPLDTEYPEERLAYIIEDSGIELLLTQNKLRERLPYTGSVQILALDTFSLNHGNHSNPAVAVQGENLAYIIYTSGSTGKPKGAAIRHNSLTRCMMWMQETYSLTPADAVLHKAPFGFDVSVWEIFWPLMAGVKLVVANPGDHRDPKRIIALIREHQITTLNFVPAMLQAFLASEGIVEQTRLRYVICGGEAMPAAVKSEALRRLVGASLQNLYGPTETTIHVTQWTCVDDGKNAVPIGAPIAGTSAYVLDSALCLTPPGIAGELYIAGDLLGRGYLNQPGLSAERFIANPFGVAGERLYRTGDLVRWNAEGQLDYLGRVDQQVKLRGFRIEIGEIEAQLMAHPAVREAVVVLKESPAGARLVGYVSGDVGQVIDVAQLRTRLNQTLPDYMVPSAIIVLDVLPLNPNGKVDRKALPEPQFGGELNYEPPQGNLEEDIARIWAELLGVEAVGRYDNFFELGGHSLLALKLLERLRSEGWPSSVRTLFKHPRLMDFAQQLALSGDFGIVQAPPNRIPSGCSALQPEMLTLVDLTAEEIAQIELTIPGGAANIQDIYPLAPLQEGLLFHHLLAAGHHHDVYVTCHLLGFGTEVQLIDFIARFNNVIARHDILRTAILWENLREPVQVVCRSVAMSLKWLTLDGQRDAVEQVLAAVTPGLYPTDVRQAPLIRAVAAYDSGKNRWLLRILAHHLILDHTTLERVISEIAAIRTQGYEHLEPPVPFRDFVAQARQRTDLAKHKAFFVGMLGDIDEPTAPFQVLDIHSDSHPRNPDQAVNNIEETQLPLASQLSIRVRQQARRYRVSVAALFHLAWALVVGKTSGRQDVVFGTVLFGRMQGGKGADRALGLFINTLPVRINLDQSVALCLAQMHTRLTDLLDHEYASLTLAQSCSSLPAATPLFTTLFNYRYSQPTAGHSAQEWEGIEILDVEERTNYPFLMSVNDMGNDLALVGQAVGSVGASRICDYMQAAVQELVMALESRPAQAICELLIMDQPEQEQLTKLEMPVRHFRGAEPVHRSIEQQVAKTPDATAVIFGNQQLTYSELNRAANRLAHFLIRSGVTPDTRVGIAVERSIDSITGLLAIIKAGGAYVPLDPDYPVDRLSYMVADSGISLLLTQTSVRDRIPGQHSLQVIELDSLDVSTEPDSNPVLAITEDNLIYVLYTSGSTGTPKGVAMPHHVLAQLVDWQQQQLPGAYRTLLFASPCFDVAFQETVSTLATGGTLVQTRDEQRRDLTLLLELMVEQSVERLFLPFAVLQIFTESALAQAVQLPNLKQVITAGEQLKLTTTLRSWLAQEPQCLLTNHYGPTESHVVSDFLVDPADGAELPPIGKPASNAHLYVLDTQMQRVPNGIAGELYIGSQVLARGYLNRPGLTAERFVANPFRFGERLYRTGDLVRWNSAGQLDYMGRADHQVKVRGYRVEPGEVEAQLCAQPDVKEAVVLTHQNRNSIWLVAYVSAQPGKVIKSSGLREQLAQTLPDYMVPSVVMVLDALPLNPNGKVDRKSLPAPEFGNEQYYAPPQGEVEEGIARIWGKLLGVERVGRYDNFFELGGHSLLALKLLEHLRREGLSTSVRNLFKHPRLMDFAQTLADNKDNAILVIPPNRIPVGCNSIAPEMLTLIDLPVEEIAYIEAAIPGGAVNIQDIYPLAPLQEGLLFHHLLQKDGDVYIVLHTVAFDTKVRLTAFVDSFNQVIARHDILRTAILWENLSAPVQVVCRQARVDLQWFEPGQDELFPTNMARHLAACFHPDQFRIDVRQAPMIHALAAYDPEHQRWILQLASHHMVLDHTTLEHITREINLIQQGHHDALPAPVPFRNFVAHARLGVSEAEHRAFFSTMLGDVDEPTAPFGLHEVLSNLNAIEHLRIPLATDLATQLRQQASRYGTGAATLFHLAWALVIARTTGRDDVVFGTVLFGRMQSGSGSDRGLGLFINTLPIRVRLAASGVEQALMQTQETLSNLLHHEHASLALAQRCSGIASETPLFSSLLNYRHNGSGATDGHTAQWEGVEVLTALDGTNYPVGMSVDDWGDRFELFGQVTSELGAQRICDYFYTAIQEVVLALAEEPTRLMNELGIMPPQERDQLVEWGCNTRRYEDAKPLHQLFEYQVRQQPEKIAVLFGNEQLSYTELNRRANQLAHYLITLGVKPEAKVGIAVERSLEMVVGLLGILKAGGTYVPLDSEYPQERLVYMVGDSGVECLLTQHHLRARLLEFTSIPVIELDRFSLETQPDHNPQIPVTGDNLVYVIYTSGSTGKPKGAANRHVSVSSCMLWMQDTYHLTDSDTVLHKAPFGFDVSVWELFWPLTSGARLVLAGPGDHRDPMRIIQLIRMHRITTLNFVPAMLQAFLAQEGIEHQTHLRNIICGGEAMPAETQKETLTRLHNAGLQNLYGPTEAAIHVTRWSCRDDGKHLVPIGRPISGTHTWILDSNLNPVPQGVAGELYLGGIGLGRGYLNRPALTAERFVANPQGTDGGQLYRTGDLVRWNREGQLEFLGRIDHQVKIRGFRIELGEVEAQLLAQPEVREVVVTAQKGSTGMRLVGYVGLHKEREVDHLTLRTRLAASLPDYMVPAIIVVMDTLPLNANGKVDRKALPEPEFVHDRGYIPPQGKEEEAIAGIWCDLLGVEQISRYDNFFELGGHSLLALKLLQRLHQYLGDTRISLAQVLQNAVLVDLVKVLVAGGDADTGIITLSSEGSGVPLYCFPGTLANSSEYQKMATGLAGDRPVYAFASHALSGNRWDDYSVERLAAEYADSIRRHTKTTSCTLLGWSLGADLAFETARQLHASGVIQVVFLGLVDGIEHDFSVVGEVPEAEHIRLQERIDTWLAQSTMKEKWHELMCRMSPELWNYCSASLLSHTAALPLDGSALAAVEYQRWAALDSLRMLSGYTHNVIDVPLYVWSADSATREGDTRLRKWSRYGEVIASREIFSTDHMTILAAEEFIGDVRATLCVAEANFTAANTAVVFNPDGFVETVSRQPYPMSELEKG